MKRFTISLVLSLMFALVLVLAVALAGPLFAINGLSTPARAEGPTDPIAARLEQEPALTCVAKDLNMPVYMVVVAKLNYDHDIGLQYGFTKDDSRWPATWWNRWQTFTSWLGVVNPMVPDYVSGAHPRADCQRLIDAQKMIEASNAIHYDP